MKSIKISNEKEIYVVSKNGRVTAGGIPSVYTESRVCATNNSVRLESNNMLGAIEKYPIFKINNVWYGPINITLPTNHERKDDEKIEEQLNAIRKMKEAGVSKETLLSSGLNGTFVLEVFESK